MSRPPWGRPSLCVVCHGCEAAVSGFFEGVQAAAPPVVSAARDCPRGSAPLKSVLLNVGIFAGCDDFGAGKRLLRRWAPLEKRQTAADRLKSVTQEKDRLKSVLRVFADFFAARTWLKTTKDDGLPYGRLQR